MEKSQVIETLHTLERKLLPHLKTNSKIKEIIKSSGMQEVEILRAL